MEEGKSGGRMSSFAREVGEVLHMFQYIKNFQKPAQMPRRPICSFASLLPPGVEWSRPVAELSGKWHCPSLAGVGRADQGRAAGRQAVGGLETGEPRRGAAPRPAQSRQPHLPQTTFPVLFVLPYACLWLSCLAASPSAGARIPSVQGTAQKGSSALCLIGGCSRQRGRPRLGSGESWLSESGSSSCPRAPSPQEEQGTKASSC